MVVLLCMVKGGDRTSVNLGKIEAQFCSIYLFITFHWGGEEGGIRRIKVKKKIIRNNFIH